MQRLFSSPSHDCSGPDLQAMPCMRNCSIADESAKRAIQWRTSLPPQSYPSPNQNLVGDPLRPGWPFNAPSPATQNFCGEDNIQNRHISSWLVNCQISDDHTCCSGSVRLDCIGVWSIILGMSRPAGACVQSLQKSKSSSPPTLKFSPPVTLICATPYSAYLEIGHDSSVSKYLDWSEVGSKQSARSA